LYIYIYIFIYSTKNYIVDILKEHGSDYIVIFEYGYRKRKCAEAIQAKGIVRSEVNCSKRAP